MAIGIDTLQVRNAEHLFEGKSAVVIGGASGTGEALSKALVSHGAQTVITSRVMEKMLKVQSSFAHPERVIPLELDVTDVAHIHSAVDRLETMAIQPDMLILSSAGGLEKLMRPMLKFLFQMQRLDTQGRAAKLAEFNASIAQWTTELEIHKHALAENFQGSVDVFEAMVPSMKDGGTVIYISSIPSSFSELMLVPSFYYWIARTKRMFELHLMGRAVDLAQRGIQTAIISGGLLSDTPMGQILIQKGLPLLATNQQFPPGYQFPTTEDMVQAMMEVLQRKPDESLEAPVYKFVAGRGDIRDSMDPHDPVANFPFPI